MGQQKSKRYFGTDGIRGKVGDAPINPEFVLKLGWAVGCVLGGANGRKKVIIGKDTRISGYMFESALQAGLSAAGADIRLLGPMPTPAIAYLTRTLHAQAGIVISASHNPYYDNGIKFFSSEGRKLPDELEFEIEEMLDQPMTIVDSSMLGKAERVVDAGGRYIEYCKSTIPSVIDLRGLKIVIDCAHGATYHVTPSVFSELGAKVIKIGVDPNGLNINKGCGSTHPEALIKEVLTQGADLGIALDGDGDRVIMVDDKGEVVDGDELLYIIAASRKARLGIAEPVVGTLMSNLGLEHALARLDMPLHRANVGDRYVMEILTANGWNVGGESSGHIICLDKSTTGDGTVAALQVVTAMVQNNRSLHELKQGMTKYPQCLINVRTEAKFDFASCDIVNQAKQDVETKLGNQGRVLLRASGTEPLIRVMVEGENEALVYETAQQLADAVKKGYQQR